MLLTMLDNVKVFISTGTEEKKECLIFSPLDVKHLFSIYSDAILKF